MSSDHNTASIRHSPFDCSPYFCDPLHGALQLFSDFPTKVFRSHGNLFRSQINFTALGNLGIRYKGPLLVLKSNRSSR